MEVADFPDILRDSLDDIALHALKMEDIIEQTNPWTFNLPDDIKGFLRIGKLLPGNRLQNQCDSGLFRKRSHLF